MELDKLKEIIARELQHVKKEEITEDSRFVEDLNADSLDIVQIIMGIEEEFGIEIPEEASFQIPSWRRTWGTTFKIKSSYCTP